MQLSPEQAQGMAMFMIAGFEKEIPTTTKVLAAVPQDKLDFTLGDKGRTTKDLMWHIITTDIWFTDGISSGEFAQGDTAAAPDSVKEMVSQYESGMRAGMEKLKAMKGEQLAKPINFFNVMNFPAVMYVGFLNNHCIHHRGQLSTYIRAMNAHVPSIYGGSADEPFQPPAK